MTDAARWITVGELAHAFAPDAYAPSFSPGLAGKRLTLHQEDGARWELEFLSDSELRRSRVTDDGTSTSAKEAYFAMEQRPGIFLVDLLPVDQPRTSVDILLDLDRAIATTLVARMPEREEMDRPFSARIAAGLELTAVEASFTSARIDHAFTPDTDRHEPTLDLVGRRVEYTYSPSERYEHIYLNERFYTWQCLEGSEKGLADTDRCHYLGIGPDLYLFVWREKIVPTVGVVLLDYQAMRTAGKICGLRGDGSDQLSNFPVGARARLLNVTTY